MLYCRARRYFRREMSFVRCVIIFRYAVLVAVEVLYFKSRFFCWKIRNVYKIVAMYYIISCYINLFLNMNFIVYLQSKKSHVFCQKYYIIFV